MTNKQALKKAVFLFGKCATVQVAPCLSREDFVKRNGEKAAKHWEKYFGKKRYTVGRIIYGCFNEVFGDGLSWEEAFEMAVLKKKGLL